MIGLAGSGTDTEPKGGPTASNTSANGRTVIATAKGW